jgi:hypothetical protein
MCLGFLFILVISGKKNIFLWRRVSHLLSRLQVDEERVSMGLRKQHLVDHTYDYFLRITGLTASGMYVCMCMFVFVCMYVFECMYVYIYMYVYVCT